MTGLLRRCLFGAVAAAQVSLFAAQNYDIAAYVWPAYQPEPRWSELGIFGDGKGEWQNVWEAVPKWKGHNQPLRPLWGYEDESDPKVVEKKIEAAVAHGVNVFIYDWYWFGGRPFLEDALNKGFLGAKNNSKMKFFIMWANHHVNWLWDNREADKRWWAPRKDWLGFVTDEEFRTKLVPRWIEHYFREPNYYRIDGKPVFMIYEVGTFINGIGGVEKAAAAIDFLRDACAKAGLGGVHLMACDFRLKREWVKALKIDSATIYNFVHWSDPAGNPDYADWAKKGAMRFDTAKDDLGVPTYFAHASVGWDTNPRYPAGSVQPSAIDSTPEKFEAVLRRAKDWTDANTSAGCPRLITVNSWNEWTEGSYLEPDKTFGFGYLEAVRRVFGGAATPAEVPRVSSWRGVNLLGLFNSNPQKPDPRVRGKFEEHYFRWLRDWGLNFARLPMDYRYFLSTNDWTTISEEGLAKVDQAVAWGRKYGVHVQLCLHRAPGYTVTWWDPERTHLQSDSEPQSAFIRLWRTFARRYRGISNAELSFNLINEPRGFTESQYIDVFGRTIAAIREEDPGRFVMLDGNDCASKPVEHFYDVPLTGQAFRGYAPHAISHYQAWYIKSQPETEPSWPLSPEMARRPDWIYESPAKTLEKFKVPLKAGYPVMIGEFGCYNRLRHQTCLAWMEDCLRLWEKEGLGWAIWNVDGPFGFMDSARTDVAYEDFEGHQLDREMLNLLRKYAGSDANPTPWKDPQVNAINRLPARAPAVPCESEELALAIARGLRPKTDSKWILSLNGTWDFAFKRAPTANWEKRDGIAVPGCWQLQGDYDPPLFINQIYPFADDFTNGGDPTGEPKDKSWTSFVYRNPVGLYTRTFELPEDWRSRRTVIRFDGVSSAMFVRLNGRRVGYSEDSRVPAEFDLTPYLKDGENALEVEVFQHCDGSFLEGQDFWRMSGIFRDVTLISESHQSPKDLVVETWLAEDYSQGGFRIREEKGKVLKERTIDKPALWSPERPNLSYVTIECPSGLGNVSDYRAVAIGFRRIEIKDGIFCLNGQRAVFRGVNRHEMEPASGYTVTDAGMKKDMEIFKFLNINAVRTCHYPNVDEWYSLCDREGIMVISEANVESHGRSIVGPLKTNSYSYAENWRAMHVERNVNMVKSFRNHPSVIVWSMGNEAGSGDNFVAAYEALKDLDPTRPVQYQGVLSNPASARCSDIQCPMYLRPWEVEAYVTNSPARPLVLCEYSHACGNSNGDIQEYWDLVRKYPSMQGGFIWDFVDQAVWKNEKASFLAYGGDFGDRPNDGNGNCDGIVSATRELKPGAFEVKHAYSPVRTESFDWRTGVAQVFNGYMFLNLREIDCTWVLEREGREVARGGVLLDGRPGTVAEAMVTRLDGDAVTFVFKDARGREISRDQFVRPFVPKKVKTLRSSKSSRNFAFNFWRAPTDNDRGWRMESVCKVWSDATRTQKLPEGCTSELKISSLEEGVELVDWTFTVASDKLPPIPRVGLTFTVPSTYTNVTWYGLGPHENYVDRRTSAVLGIHSAVIGLASGYRDPKTGRVGAPANALNPDLYIRPSEQGYRTGVRSLKFIDAVGEGIELQALNAPFGFNAWPYPQTMLEGKRHQFDLRKSREITVNVDAAQMGVGGDNSWGNRPHDEAMLGKGVYRLVFTIRNLHRGWDFNSLKN